MSVHKISKRLKSIIWHLCQAHKQADNKSNRKEKNAKVKKKVNTNQEKI